MADKFYGAYGVNLLLKDIGDVDGVPMHAIGVSDAGGGGGGGTSAIGSPSDAAWTGTGDGTVIAVLKGIYNQLNLTNTELGEIDQNTLIANGLLDDIKTNTSPG